MREIKFRTFNKSNGEMYYALYGCFLHTDLSLRPSVNHEVMQYTGLKDKNGKEIYEGDIVTWQINGNERTGPVYYDELQASFWIGKDIETQYLVLNDWMRGEHEVIGNIYKNAELLKP